MTVDELEEYGVQPMDDAEVEAVLSTQHLGVLGLPGEASAAPILRPLSFTYDGDDRLYFVYVEGSGGRKGPASDRAAAARFLVYRAETAFNWRSVILTGEIDRVTEVDEDDPDWPDAGWRPDVFERAEDAVATATYRFSIADRVGLKHVGLPAGFSGGDGDGASGE